MRRVLLLLALVAPARAGTPEVPRLYDPFPFDHAVHGGVFERVGVTCVDCHPVGLRVPSDQGEQAPSFEPKPPLGSCHGCHRAELAGAPRSAPGECMLCHADLEQLKPPSHGIDWVAVHGPDARARGAECSACHETASCVDCHEARGNPHDNPHPPGFRTGHGLEARLDPMSCSTCHAGEKCTSCHTTGAIPW